MPKITPFLWFEDSAHQAAEFYVSIFPSSKIKNITKIDNTPSGTVEIISVELDGHEFTLMSAGPFDKFNQAISFVIDCRIKQKSTIIGKNYLPIPNLNNAAGSRINLEFPGKLSLNN